jgi:hypothetical protein
MNDQAHSIVDVRHCVENINGRIVSSWELATAWDWHGTPNCWRTLHSDDPEDERLLWDLGLVPPPSLAQRAAP